MVTYQIGEKVIWTPGRDGEYEIVMKGLFLEDLGNGFSRIQSYMRNGMVVRQILTVENILLKKDPDTRSPFEIAGMEETRTLDGERFFVNDEGEVNEVFPVGVQGLYTELEARSRRRTFVRTNHIYKNPEEALNGEYAEYKPVQ